MRNLSLEARPDDVAAKSVAATDHKLLGTHGDVLAAARTVVIAAIFVMEIRR
ncbi:hypothetical protein [Mesorhizobium atlanticum]|uniref:hypothetical protein n=1 Tax=Mesorhizobium atlanticum TaxID=2233532 RepID=UPI0015EC14A6|nr:hypothetical protein [Mesorhizobium atlanticum]